MGVTTYYSADGELLGHRTDVGAAYGTDALGSVTVTAIDDQQRTPTNYYYKPYGSRLNKLGNYADPRYLWNGTSGYRETAISHSKSYVQARHLGQEEGRWTTRDRILRGRYRYAVCSPATFFDPHGMQVAPNPIGLGPSIPRFPLRCHIDNEAVYRYCYWCNRVGRFSYPSCVKICNYLAGSYYRACKKPRRKWSPYEDWVPQKPGIAPVPRPWFVPAGGINSVCASSAPPLPTVEHPEDCVARTAAQIQRGIAVRGSGKEACEECCKDSFPPVSGWPPFFENFGLPSDRRRPDCFEACESWWIGGGEPPEDPHPPEEEFERWFPGFEVEIERD